MPQQTATRFIESDSEPAKFFELLCEAANIPRWAPVFADRVALVTGSRYRAVKNGDAFDLEVFANKTAGTVDYIRELPGGRSGGAYIRVTPLPLGGASITMTVPIAPNTTEAAVATVLEEELALLVRLVQG